VNDQPSITDLQARQMTREAVYLCVAWIALLVTLIAFPSVRLLAALEFVGLFVAIGFRWSIASRRAAASVAPVPSRGLNARVSA
jgi:hypothetical protein